MQERKKEVYRQIDFNIASIRLFSASKLSFACLNYLSKAVNCIRWVFAEWGGREEKIKIGAQWPCDDQCEQIGRLFKVQAKKLLTKVAQKHLLPILKSITLCKNCCCIYLGNFWKYLGYIFTPISGHTVVTTERWQCDATKFCQIKVLFHNPGVEKRHVPQPLQPDLLIKWRLKLFQKLPNIEYQFCFYLQWN